MAARVALVPGCASDCDAFIVGSTQSTVADGFVVTANAPQANLATGEGGLSNAFMMIVGGDGSGSTPVFSTYYGGTSNGTEGDVGLGITVASLNEVAITGATFSGASGKTADEIPLSNPAQSSFLGGTTTSMAFVAAFDQEKVAAQALHYGTYLGGSGTENSLSGVANGDFGTAIVYDNSTGNFWVAGSTASTNFPVNGVTGVSTTNPPYQSQNEPEANVNVGSPATTGFITELNPNGSPGLGQVIYSTYFGGNGLCLVPNFDGGCMFGT